MVISTVLIGNKYHEGRMLRNTPNQELLAPSLMSIGACNWHRVLGVIEQEYS